VKLTYSGKVRDVITDGDDLILVASDRVSVYDVMLPTLILGKGAVLTRLSSWWFEQLADIMPNHVISTTDVPEQWLGRGVRCRRLDMVKVECIARGYVLEGFAQLPEPIFTPTTKAPHGHHDLPMSYQDVVDQEGAEQAAELQAKTLEIYQRGAAIALDRGIIIADTKVEFGRTEDGTLVLADEVLTSDSSRFWDADTWEPGQVPRSLDKQIVRDWATGTGWDRTAPGPPIPDDVAATTWARYIEAYERLTGMTWGS